MIHEVRVTNDGKHYLSPSPRRRPFHLRWLVPYICRQDALRWVWCSRFSLLLLGLSAYFYAGSRSVGLFVAVSMLGLAGVSRFNLRYPILVDLPAMALTLGSAALWPHSHVASILVVLMAGCAKETAPVFASLYAWNPWLLLGLLPVAIRAALFRSAPIADSIWEPVTTAWKVRQGTWGDPTRWVLPWGILLVALYHPTWQVAAILAAAYGQCLIASDTVRLYQWAWPVLAVATARTLGPAWLLPAIVIHMFNPFMGNGT